jgi:hypothetical protein
MLVSCTPHVRPTLSPQTRCLLINTALREHKRGNTPLPDSSLRSDRHHSRTQRTLPGTASYPQHSTAATTRRVRMVHRCQVSAIKRCSRARMGDIYRLEDATHLQGNCACGPKRKTTTSVTVWARVCATELSPACPQTPRVCMCAVGVLL